MFVPNSSWRWLYIISASVWVWIFPNLYSGNTKWSQSIYVAIELHHTGMSASACQRTDARLLAYPVCQCGVEKLYNNLPTSSFTHSSKIVQRKFPHCSGFDREMGQFDVGILLFRQGDDRPDGNKAFYNRGELDIVAIYFL